MKQLISYIIGFWISISSLNAQDNLVAHWSFNNMTNDTVFDESGNEYHGMNYGASSVDGVSGTALSFDGNNDYVAIPNVIDAPPEEFSTLGKGAISVWFKVNYIPPEHGIMPVFYYGTYQVCDFFDAANMGMIIEVGHSPVQYRSERLYFTIWKNGCTYPSFCFDSGHAIETGRWYHFVAVVGENYNTGFLDGQEMHNRRYNFGSSSDSQFFEDALAHEKMWLGKGHWDREVQYLNGAIDELRIYSEALNANEVDQLYSEGQINGLNNAPEESNIQIYPNPAEREVSVELSDTENEIKSLRIKNILGKIVHEQQVVSKKFTVDIQNLAQGLYFLEFSKGKSILIKKMLINK